MKKILLSTAAITMLSMGLMAQQGKTVLSKKVSVTQARVAPNPNRCVTKVPGQKWDEEFNKMVEQHKQDLQTGRATSTTYTIPIVFHIIYSTGEAVGSGHNVSQAQVNSQIPILNADYNGTGVNTSNYANCTLNGHPAFYDYAVAAGLPAPDAGGVVIGASGIYFCLAQKNPSGTTLAEPGIDRVTWESISGATNPASSSNLNSLFDGTIKPATIWDPTKYFNVWVSDGGTSGLLGYATFPPASTSSAITPSWGETVSSVSTTDGVWMAYTALGNTGAAQSPYNLGRTLTHESGHWLGLRHIWGDGNCITDYCNDTPPASAANFVPGGTAYPYMPNSCAGTPPAGNGPDGDMFMNFMDYSDDAAMYMFTTDQVNRFHSALSLSPWRSGLTASAANLCNVTVSTPTAAFTPPTGICSNVPATFSDGSSGPPTSWNWSVNPSAGVTITTNTVSSPSITFPAAGTYTVTDAVSNTSGNNSVSHTVSVTSCSLTACDTLSNFLASDTLTLYVNTSTVVAQNGGYISGNNAYGDLAKAEFHSGTNYAGTQITGVMALFFKSGTIGTKGTHTVTMNIMNGNNTSGPSGAAIGTATASLTSIVATTPKTGVTYCGNPNLGFGSAIILPYKFALPTPVATPTVGFFTSLVLPTTTGDTAVIFQNTFGSTNATNTAWELNTPSPGTWAAVNTDWGFTSGVTFALLPIVCPLTGIAPNTLTENIAFFPNPSNGQVNFALTLPTATNLNFTVVNTLGQVVYTKTENNVSHAVLSYDLSSLGKGVYFITILDSENNKTVKKLIIQ